MKSSRLWLSLVLGAAVGFPAEAVTNVTVQLGVNPNFIGGTGPFNQSVTQTAPGELTSGLVTGGFSSSGTGHAFADIGTIKLDGTSEGSLNSVARGIFRDSFKIDLPGVPSNTQVQIDFAINVDGLLSVGNSNGASASWQLRADVGGGAFDLGADATLYNNSPSFGTTHGYVGSPMGLLHGSATVLTGQVMPIDIEFTASAQTSYDGFGGAPATASFDFSHTVTWAGMTVLLGGVAQPQAVLTSGSGFNYLQAAAVPEPASAALWGLGAAFLLWRRRD